MRQLRFRFTIRRLMVVVALAALAMCLLKIAIEDPAIIPVAFLLFLVFGPIALMLAGTYWTETT
jgi:hypothetical protein